MSASLAIYGLLPALFSGYLFNLLFCYTHYPFRQAESQRLFIQSAGAGLALTFIVFAMVSIFRQDILGMLKVWGVRRWISVAHESLPVEHAASLLLVFVSGPILALILNMAVTIARFLKAIFQRVDYMPMAGWMYWRAGTNAPTGYEVLIHEAHRENKLVLLNLKSRKVYCGEVIHPPAPDRSGSLGCVKILPKLSSFRDKDTLEVCWEKAIKYPIYEIWLLRGFLTSLEAQVKRAKKRSRSLRQIQTIVPAKLAFGSLMHYVRVKRAIALLEIQVASVHSAIQELSPMDGFIPNFQDWVKVVSLSEIESVSIYYDGIAASWFTSRTDGEPKAAS